MSGDNFCSQQNSCCASFVVAKSIAMSQFYTRYIPPPQISPSHSKSATDTDNSRTSEKRKHNTVVERPKKDKGRKRQRRFQILASDVDHDTDKKDGVHSEEPNSVNGTDILSKYSITTQARLQNGDNDITIRDRSKRAKKERKQDESVNQEQAADLTEKESEADPTQQKHTTILSKFEKSRNASRHLPEESPVSTLQDTNVEFHGLEPIPQPEIAELVGERPTFSALPTWQSGAMRIDRRRRLNFGSMGISKTTLVNLKSHQIEQAFPIQSTVIPLLMSEERRDQGDVCVSAATGSGKTLAYVLPIIEALKKNPRQGLRAVIVVPTRELVKQVRETLEICTAGSNIRIATAVGTKSLKEEQNNLVQEEDIYDPVEYEKQQNALIDLVNFNIEKLLQKVRDKDMARSVNLVTKYYSKVDILVTTPGRLVDHIKNTTGFNLDHVEWLVVDEADRLLNESYQEWIDAVVPALQSQNATRRRDEILSYMRMDIPERSVRKVLLSATMTQDISKLNSMGLKDPKLIILGTPTTTVEGRIDEISETEGRIDPELKADSSGIFHLPGSLYETAVTFKDGTYKPLILLDFLSRHIIGAQTNSPHESAIKGHNSKSDSDETSSSESEASSGGDSSASSSSEADSSSASDTSSDGSSSDASSTKHDSPASKRKAFRHDKIKPSSTQSTEQASKTTRVLIFTRSTASASRLARLLSLISPSLSSQIAILTRSSGSSAASRQALTSFRNGKTPILIATDRVSRGIDVTNLEHVVSYDVPGSALTYVHRVGRTARAGKTGHAWTLVEHREGRWFWNEIGGKSDQAKIRRSQKVKKLEMKVEDELMKGRYESALQTLGEEVRAQ